MTSDRITPVNLHTRRSRGYWVRAAFSAASVLFVAWLFTHTFLTALS